MPGRHGEPVPGRIGACRRPPDRPRHRRDPGIRGLDEAREEGRDAVRPPRTRSQTGSASPPRSKRCKRRVPPGRNPPEPPKTRKTDPRRADTGLRARPQCAWPDHPSNLQADSFNTIRADRSFAASRCCGVAACNDRSNLCSRGKANDAPRQWMWRRA